MPGAIHTSEKAERAARRLRSEATYAERQLWKVLRRLEGFHFRRQAPIGPYVVDFVCHRARVAVEVDGGIHRLAAVSARDEEREAWLTAKGFRIVRISNAQAILATDAAVEAILAAVAPTPTPPALSPQGGGVQEQNTNLLR
jgi:very-short-patch-repair endonuclease